MSEWENPNGGSSEYYTPPEIMDAIGLSYDMDVAAPWDWPTLSGVSYWVTAHLHMTGVPPCDGLKEPWKGCVWMNPPFGKRNGIVPWLKKFVEHGNGCGLVRAYTSSAWFHEWIPQMDSILFPRGKTQFYRPDGTVAKSPGHGIVLFAKGQECVDALRNSGLGMFFDLRGE